MVGEIYNLSVLEAVAVNKVLEAGRTKPVLVDCASVSSTKLEKYVVKLFGDIELEHRSLAREVFGSLLAEHFEIQTPKIAIINIPSNLLKESPDKFLRERFTRSAGYNFGSEYQKDVYQFQRLALAHIQEAISIFAFDILIHNYDRRIDKANMFQVSDGLIVFDHEMAFPYADPGMLLGDEPPPTGFSENDDFVRNHVLFRDLKALTKREDADYDFDIIVQSLEELTGVVIDSIIDQIPTEWHSDDLDNIKGYLLSANGDPAGFVKSLKEVLA